jgi:hypothetical protein
MKADGSEQNYRWPWLLLGAVLVAIALAVMWMNYEVQRTKRIRDANLPAGTNATNQP